MGSNPIAHPNKNKRLSMIGGNAGEREVIAGCMVCVECHAALVPRNGVPGTIPGYLRYHCDMAKTLSRDTAPEAEVVQLEVLRGLSAWRKWELVEESSRLTRILIVAGIKARYPGISEDEVCYRVHEAILGETLADAVYGETNGKS